MKSIINIDLSKTTAQEALDELSARFCIATWSKRVGDIMVVTIDDYVHSAQAPAIARNLNQGDELCYIQPGRAVPHGFALPCGAIL